MKTALFASLLLLVPLAASADGLPDQAYISVSGHGELQVAPDMAYVPVVLEASREDAKVARADVEARTAKVIALARKLGIADKDIDAPAVTVYPEWGTVKSPVNGNRQVITGYRVMRTLSLTLRDLTRYGELADGLFDAGITDLGDPALDRSDRKMLEQKARALAVADARDMAAGLAQSAGVTLGTVYSIAEQGGGFAPRPMMAMAAAKSAASPEYLNGKIEINAEVSVLYLIGK
jgi:hypothetical protein